MPRTKSILQVPKGYEVPLLAKDLSMQIRSGESEGRQVRKDRFDRVYQQYLQEGPVPVEKDFDGASESTLNIMQVKIDALGTNVMRTMTTQEPYCVAQTFNTDGANSIIEKVVQFFAVKAGVEDRLSSVSPDAGLFNVGIIHNEWTDGDWQDPTPGERLSAIEVQDFFIYPPSIADEPMKAWSMGHRVWVSKSDLELMKARGEIADIPSHTGDPGSVREENFPNVSGHIHHETAGSKDNDLAELWWVYYRDRKNKRDRNWYRALVSEKDDKILYSQKLTKKLPCYHVFRYKNTKGEFWSKSSVGNDLQGVQLDASSLVRKWLDGIDWNVQGVGFAQSSGSGEQFIEVKPGALTEGEWQEAPNYQFPKADLSHIPVALGWFVDYADQIARISQSGTGGKEGGETTATQAAIMRAGQQAGVDDYIQTAGKGLVSLYASIHEDLVENMGSWYPVFGDFLQVSEEETAALRMKTQWRLNTKSIGTTPGAQLQVVQMLSEKQAIGMQSGGSSIDPYMLDTLTLQLAVRLGLPGAEKMQLPKDPQQMIVLLAQTMGIDPELLMEGVQQAQQATQAIQEAEKNVAKQKQIETVATGLGVPVEDRGSQGANSTPKLPGGGRRS